MKVEVSAKNLSEGARNLEILRQIRERHQHSRVRIAGKTMPIDAQTANLLVTVHDALNVDNKVKFVAMLAQSPATFQRLVDFSWKQVA